MSTITTRSGKGAPLTNSEVDSNFTNLNTDKAELSGATFTGDVKLGDNDRIKLGDGPDLQIWHNGSNSYVMDSGTGNLKLLGSAAVEIQSQADNSNMIVATAGGAVTLYNANSPKLATTSTGIDVTGSVVADGLTVSVGGITQLSNIARIGDNSAVADLTLNSSDSSVGTINFADASDSNVGRIQYNHVDNTMILRAADATRVLVSSTGIDVTGTATMDGLTVDGNVESLGTFILNNGTDKWQNLFSTNDLIIRNNHNTSWYNRLRISYDGDISFYEDTGTTPKLFWDASAESLGIGTSSPQTSLSIETSGTQNVASPIVTGQTAGVTYGGLYTVRDGTGDQRGLALNVYTANVGLNEAIRIDSAGNVGIGSSSLSASTGRTDLTLNGATSSFISMGVGGVRKAYITHDNTDLTLIAEAAGGALRLGTVGTERMRIDSAGNLLLNRTLAFTTAKMEIQSDAGDPSTLALNSIDTDGSMLEFYKAGATVGSIGTNSNTIYIDGSAANTGLQFAGSTIAPRDSGALSDAGVDLGTGSFRFKDLYLSGGVYLGGTGAANKLDDYEEGTWTATFYSGINGTGTNVGTKTANYIKVGNMVTVSYDGSVLTGSPLCVHGLPFTTTDGRLSGVTSDGAVVFNNGSSTIINYRSGDGLYSRGTFTYFLH